jgi:hypothetical protein
MGFYRMVFQREKGGVYYFRQVVPLELREEIGKREIKESLHTKDKAEADIRHREKALEVAKQFEDARARKVVPYKDRQAFIRFLEDCGIKNPDIAVENGNLDLSYLERELEKCSDEGCYTAEQQKHPLHYKKIMGLLAYPSARQWSSLLPGLCWIRAIG